MVSIDSTDAESGLQQFLTISAICHSSTYTILGDGVHWTPLIHIAAVSGVEFIFITTHSFQLGSRVLYLFHVRWCVWNCINFIHPTSLLKYFHIGSKASWDVSLKLQLTVLYLKQLEEMASSLMGFSLDWYGVPLLHTGTAPRQRLAPCSWRLSRNGQIKMCHGICWWTIRRLWCR